MSMVSYDWDGSDTVISCRSQAAKYIDARRDSSVVFAVPDDLDILTGNRHSDLPQQRRNV